MEGEELTRKFFSVLASPELSAHALRGVLPLLHLPTFADAKNDVISATSGQCARDVSQRCAAKCLLVLCRTLLNPIIDNILRDQSNERFRSLSVNQPLIAALWKWGPAAKYWFDSVGFTLDELTQRFILVEPDANRLIVAQAAVTFLQKCTMRFVLTGQLSTEVIATNTAVLPALKSRAEQQRADIEHAEALLKRQTALGREVVEASPSLCRDADILDKSDPRVEAARRTIHTHGRLRNAFFESKSFQVATMTNGRWLQCACCAPTDLELHWHLRTGNSLYSFTVHLSASGDKVLHLGPELAYQYNNLPGTPHFQQTVLVSRKWMDTTGGELQRLETCEAVVDACQYCAVSFRTLWTIPSP